LIASDVVGKELGIRTETIPGGLDTNVFYPRSKSDLGTATRTRLNLPQNVPIILHVGRLDSEKNVDRIIQASASVMKQTIAHLLIVGDGRERSALMKLSRSLGIADCVHFAGYLSLKDGLADIYRTANVFVMASEVESQGLVLLEAAASGLPLVALDTTTISEIVHHEVNGYLVKPGDIRALSNAITKIIMDPGMAEVMGIESRRLSLNYDSRHVESMHEQFYTRLIEARKTRKRGKHSSWKRVKVWMGFSE
jgi:glycosyltransferase involved in cell wall biosynthesis